MDWSSKRNIRKGAIYGIVGNKANLFEYIEVSDEEEKKYVKENDALFLLASAKEDSKGFQKFLDKLIEKYIEKNIDKVSKEKNGKKLTLKNTKTKEKKTPSLSHTNFCKICPPLMKYTKY